MQEKLKPCPVCGHVPDRYDWQSAPDGRSIQRYCNICDMTGPSARMLEDADAAWNALTCRQHWTKEKPTEPGFWFYRRDSSGVGIILVGHDGEDLCVMSGGKCCPVTDFGNGVLTEWAGPIPEPEE